MASKVDEFLRAEAQGINADRKTFEKVVYKADDILKIDINTERIGARVLSPEALKNALGNMQAMGATVGAATARALPDWRDRDSVYGQLANQSSQGQPKPQTLRTVIDENIERQEKCILLAQANIDRYKERISELREKKQRLEFALDLKISEIDELRSY